MTDTTPSASSVVYGVFDGSRTPPSLSPVDAAALASALPALPSAPPPESSDDPEASGPFKGGSVLLNRHILRRLREAKLLSQQELADALCRRHIQVSIATIKRAETGHRVRFRIAREFAVYFGVEFDELLR
ncbi:MAG: helix-turn-helix transcriptional regulator [Pseudomonadota bacterium]